MKNKIAIVKWYDAYTSPEQTPRELARKDKGIPTVSIGHLVSRTKHGIRLSTIGHIMRDGEFDYRDEHFIPQGMIHSVTIRRV